MFFSGCGDSGGAALTEDFFQDDIQHDAVEQGNQQPGDRITAQQELHGPVMREDRHHPENPEETRPHQRGPGRQHRITESAQTAAGNIHDGAEEERAEHDYYATEPKAIDCLLEKAKLDKNIWEIAAGEGHLSKRLIELGYNVKSTDLVYRGFCAGGGGLSCM